MPGWRSKEKAQPEKKVEAYLKDKVEGLGGICWKFTSPGTTGVPDRIVIMDNLQFFVETKRPKGGKLSDTQKWRIRQIRKQGAICYVLKNTDEIDYLISHIVKGSLPDESIGEF